MKIVLLDGNSFCYRAFYAIRELRNSRGEPTNAIYGFITMLEGLISRVRPDGVAVTFDVKGPTFRHKRYEDYKIQRLPMPEELIFQMPLIKEVIAALGIPIYEKQGYEADDVLATISKRLEKSGHEVFIVTGDKDALQLVTSKIKVLNPQKEDFIYDSAEVKKRFGVGPSKVVDIMALMGDASDNIPGVPGIGDKTAIKLIGEFGSFEGVYAHLDRIETQRLRENLIKFKEQAELSRELATLDEQVPIDVDVEQLKRRDPDVGKLTALYQKYEFRGLLKKLPLQTPTEADQAGRHYQLVNTEKEFNLLVKKLAGQKAWALDFETTGTNPLLCEPVGISFSFKEHEAAYVAFAVSSQDLFSGQTPSGKKADGRTDLDAKKCLKALKPLFEDSSIAKVGQNIKYEMMVLKNYDIELAGVDFDTMVGSYVLNPAKPNHNLDDIALEHLGVRLTPIEELIGKGKNQRTMDQVELDKVYRYGCQDSDVTFRLSKILQKKIEEKDLTGLFREIEMPLVSVLAQMETVGVAVDLRLLSKLSKDMEKTLSELTRDIYKLAGAEFNINSPKQLGEILFEKLGLPVVKKTKTGASTDVEVLVELSENHALPKEILKFRELSKLKNTYIDALPLLVNPRTGRVHTSFNQTVTATGRLSSSDPNLQNIPVRKEEGRKIRRAFVAGFKDHVLISADYSQIELRVLAHLSKDEQLIKAFKHGADIHRYTAGLIFNQEMKNVNDSMRESAKTVNFGVLYGMGPFSLAKTLGITNEAARDFIKAYFERYPHVKAYLDRTVEKAKKDGFVSTYFKRRRYIPEILSKDSRTQSFAERTAINAPIQGTASDVIKLAMIQIADELRRAQSGAKMVLQVHDELVFEVPKKEVNEVAEMVKHKMQNAVSFEVPMVVDIKVGPNWVDMEDWSGKG